MLNIDTTEFTKTRYGFLLVQEYSMMAFTAAVDQIRMANRLSGKQLYEWVVMTRDGEQVFASNGMSIRSIPMQLSGKLDAVFVCGGINIETKVNQSVTTWLWEQSSRGVALGAICTGTFFLAEAGLLRDYRCTIHWENMAGMHERFPELIVSPNIFELDRDRYTCAGGSAAMDMMVHLIAKKHGWDLANEVAEEFLVERVRKQNDRQRLSIRLQLGTGQPKLMDAVEYMEANLQEPISLSEIASYIGLSNRQLQRLFQRHLHCRPIIYYKRVRLMHARQLLLQTSMRIVDVASASGFVSPPHFSKCFHKYFGISPGKERHAAPPWEERRSVRGSTC